jgi:hypothetical protein
MHFLVLIILSCMALWCLRVALPVLWSLGTREMLRGLWEVLLSLVSLPVLLLVLLAGRWIMARERARRARFDRRIDNVG